MEKRNYKEFKNISFWKEADDDILFYAYAPKSEVDISVARELVKDRLEYSEGKLMYSLIDISNMKSITKEARDYMNDPEGGLKDVLGGAFVSNSVATNVLVNLYMQINKPTVPAKFFTKKEDALNWILELKNRQKAV